MAICPSSGSNTDEIQFDYSTLPRRFVQSSDKPQPRRPSRCSAAGCYKRVKDKLQSRNCGFCRAVFCQQCTIYRRRICHVSGTLGILTNVCEKCFKIKVDSGCVKDHLSEFKKHRRERLEADSGKPACSRVYTGTKLIQKELNRLMEGFAALAGARDGFLAGLLGKKIPQWQKSAAWVEPSNENKCYQCKKKFGVFDSKHNCRIGGQVCCTKCIKKEGLIIYQDDRGGEPKWGINGKDNGPKTKYRLEIYMVCSRCLDHLETMQVSSVSIQKREFMDSVCKIHQSTSRMQRNVDKWLPEYQQEVDAMKLGMRSNEAADIERRLAKLHLNLSTTIPAIDSHVNRLLELHQQLQQSPVSEQQQKILTNVLIGTESSYKEHAKEFQCTKTQLLSQLPREKLCQVQEKVSQESILHVYAIIKKLAIDLKDYTESYNFDSIFLENVKKIELAITEEVKPLPTVRERLSCNWQDLMRDKACSIDVAQMVKTSANGDHVKIVVASQSSTILQQCSSKLKDETLDLEFQETKWCLKQAWDRFEMTLCTLYNISAD